MKNKEIKKNKNIKIIKQFKKYLAIFSICFLFVATSCTSVKEYQKSKLNDSEMRLGNRKIEKTELSFKSYREGGSGANSGKKGGGCGCN